MKDFGYRPVTVQFLGGLEVERMARYWCRSRRVRTRERKLFGLVLLACATVALRRWPARWPSLPRHLQDRFLAASESPQCNSMLKTRVKMPLKAWYQRAKRTHVLSAPQKRSDAGPTIYGSEAPT